MSDDDHDPIMYPRWMEIVGYVVLAILGIFVLFIEFLPLVLQPHA